MTKSFQTTLDRDGEELPILVEYTATSDELTIECVTLIGSEGDVLTTKDEDLRLIDEAHADFQHYKIYNL